MLNKLWYWFIFKPKGFIKSKITRFRFIIKHKTFKPITNTTTLQQWYQTYHKKTK